MTNDQIMGFISRVNLATGRRIDDNQAVILSEDLFSIGIGDGEFNRTARAYLNEQDIPRNIVKYFRDRHAETVIVEKEKDIPEKYHDALDYSYTGEQAGMFTRCVALAIRGYHGRRSEYDKWAIWFNRNWTESSGDNLSVFLVGEIDRLSGKTKPTTRRECLR